MDVGRASPRCLFVVTWMSVHLWWSIDTCDNGVMHTGPNVCTPDQDNDLAAQLLAQNPCHLFEDARRPTSAILGFLIDTFVSN